MRRKKSKALHGRTTSGSLPQPTARTYHTTFAAIVLYRKWHRWLIYTTDEHGNNKWHAQTEHVGDCTDSLFAISSASTTLSQLSATTAEVTFCNVTYDESLDELR